MEKKIFRQKLAFTRNIAYNVRMTPWTSGERYVPPTHAVTGVGFGGQRHAMVFVQCQTEAFLYSGFLRHCGYEVHTPEFMLDADDLIRSKSPRLIVTDNDAVAEAANDLYPRCAVVAYASQDHRIIDVLKSIVREARDRNIETPDISALELISGLLDRNQRTELD